MARGKKVEGMCHLCGVIGPLSYEHVPPRKSYAPILELGEFREIFGDDAIRFIEDKSIRGRVNQRGPGAYTLCSPCNNNTGAWYAKDYSRCAIATIKSVALASADGIPRRILATFIDLHPLRFVKQCLTMLLSAAQANFSVLHPRIREFVMQRDRQDDLSGMELRLHLHMGNKSRRAGGVVMVDTQSDRLSERVECTFPPFGLQLEIPGNPEMRGARINELGKYAYDSTANVTLELPLLAVDEPIPNQYTE